MVKSNRKYYLPFYVVTASRPRLNMMTNSSKKLVNGRKISLLSSSSSISSLLIRCIIYLDSFSKFKMLLTLIAISLAFFVFFHASHFQKRIHSHYSFLFVPPSEVQLKNYSATILRILGYDRTCCCSSGSSNDKKEFNFDDGSRMKLSEILSNGSINIHNIVDFKEYDLTELESMLEDHLNIGGEYQCLKKSNENNAADADNEEFNVAFIIPYRDRVESLRIFLNNMHPYLIRQNFNYAFYLIEPDPKVEFNRGLLMNIGFIEAQRDKTKWNCFFFHDVDMLPEHAFNYYSCDWKHPVQYAIAVSKWDYETDGYFQTYFGGVTAFTKEQYLKINGFSNSYFGWGAEDDDLYHRVHLKLSTEKRLDPLTGRYMMVNHKQAAKNPKREEHLNKLIHKMRHTNSTPDGISSMAYKLLSVDRQSRLFTRFYVTYDKNSILNNTLL